MQASWQIASFSGVERRLSSTILVSELTLLPCTGTIKLALMEVDVHLTSLASAQNQTGPSIRLHLHVMEASVVCLFWLNYYVASKKNFGVMLALHGNSKSLSCKLLIPLIFYKTPICNISSIYRDNS